MDIFRSYFFANAVGRWKESINTQRDMYKLEGSFSSYPFPIMCVVMENAVVVTTMSCIMVSFSRLVVG